MVNIEEFRTMALSFPNAEELPHFENTSFRIKKKIFATYSFKENRACLKLSELQQSLFCAFDTTIIYPVPNKWGKQGWTLVDLQKVEKQTFQDALSTAYQEVLQKTLPKKTTKGSSK